MLKEREISETIQEDRKEPKVIAFNLYEKIVSEGGCNEELLHRVIEEMLENDHRK